MAISIFEMILTGAVSWGVGKVLDVSVGCEFCGQKWPGRVGNMQKNSLGCNNCWREIIQFTNACDYTVQQNGTVGHAAARFSGGWQHDLDPLKGGWFAPRYDGWIFFNFNMRAMGLLGRQLVVSAELIEYDTGISYTKEDHIYKATYDDARWYQGNRIALNGKNVPNEKMDNRIFAVDLKIKSHYGDKLHEDRLLAQLWK